MSKPDDTIDIFLQPGDYFFGDMATRLRTILGSCVSITFWHPTKLMGGMCHIMLPSRKDRNISPEFNGKYADEALHLLMQEMQRINTTPSDYQVKIFGGSDMFANNDDQENKIMIGDKNIQAVKQLLMRNGFRVHAQHLGGNEHRYIVFDVWSGYVWMRQQRQAAIA